MEPMEALRYFPYLNKEGRIVSSSHTFKNISNYPDEKALMDELTTFPQVTILPIEDVANANNLPKSANIVLLGMAAKYIDILTPEQLRESIAHVFASKGEKIIKANQLAFDLGLNAVK